MGGAAAWVSAGHAGAACAAAAAADGATGAGAYAVGVGDSLPGAA